MATDLLKERFDEIEKLALAAGLRPYDVHFFEVPADAIYEVSTYGLPTRYSHWSFGRIYDYQRKYGEMGFSKIYELILNNDPSYAFLDKTNPDTINLMIAAHCFAHSDFFRNNVMFRERREKNMINVAKKHAEMIDSFRHDYGDDEVDEWLDVALAFERHIDVHQGLYRKRYEKRHVEFEDRIPKDWEDLYGERKPLLKKVLKNIYLPPHPEKDLLWFLSQYSAMEPWQQTICEIVRRESYYFYPQYRTKVMNEGWASYWHAELMRQYSFGDGNDYGVKGINHPLRDEEHLDFLSAHEKVVQPGMKIQLKVEVDEVDPTGRPTGRKIKKWHPAVKEDPRLFYKATQLNPYYVGFRMFRDIKDRWDKYFEEGHMEGEWGEKIPVTINGDQKIREVMQQEDDVSFFRNYLTDELLDELHLFAFGSIDTYQDDYMTQEDIAKRLDEMDSESELGGHEVDQQIIENKTVASRTKELEDIITAFAKSRSNYGVPSIVLRRIDESGLARLEHVQEDPTNVDLNYAKAVLKYFHKAWGRPVDLIRKEKDKTYLVSYNGHEAEANYESTDYPESVEENAPPSSW